MICVIRLAIDIISITDVSLSIPIEIQLVGIVETTIIDDISDTIRVTILLIRIGCMDRIIDTIRNTIPIGIEFTGISFSIHILISLVGVGNCWTIIIHSNDTIAVIIRTSIPDTIMISICLVRVGNIGTIISDILDTILICVILIEWIEKECWCDDRGRRCVSSLGPSKTDKRTQFIFRTSKSCIDVNESSSLWHENILSLRRWEEEERMKERDISLRFSHGKSHTNEADIKIHEILFVYIDIVFPIFRESELHSLLTRVSYLWNHRSSWIEFRKINL